MHLVGLENLAEINFNKLNGLIPVCIQHQDTLQVLMLGFMNKEALGLTLKTQRITLYSRTKQRLWVKGETSGNFLQLQQLYLDCDKDALLAFVKPEGPVCHTGSNSCFGHEALPALYWLAALDQIIDERYANPSEDSYTQSLFAAGINRVAQKMGEEAVELAIAAVADDEVAVVNETVDLLYHLFVLLHARHISWQSIAQLIQERMRT